MLYGYGCEDEEWRNISGFPNYMISNFGNVWNAKYDRFLKPQDDGRGYKFVNLCRQGKVYPMKIHRLVALAFLQRRYDTNEVNHDDGDKSYNDLDNLEWMTPTENVLHAYQTGLKIPFKRPIRIVETGEEFESILNCANAIGGDSGSIHYCLSKKRKTHRGFSFEYVELDERR